MFKSRALGVSSFCLYRIRGGKRVPIRLIEISDDFYFCGFGGRTGISLQLDCLDNFNRCFSDRLRVDDLSVLADDKENVGKEYHDGITTYVSIVARAICLVPRGNFFETLDSSTRSLL